jgi:hypothetical protein
MMGSWENPVAAAVARAVQGNQRHLLGERGSRSRAKRRGTLQKRRKRRVSVGKMELWAFPAAKAFV